MTRGQEAAGHFYSLSQAVCLRAGLTARKNGMISAEDPAERKEMTRTPMKIKGFRRRWLSWLLTGLICCWCAVLRDDRARLRS
jgi:hypothetical protein